MKKLLIPLLSIALILTGCKSKNSNAAANDQKGESSTITKKGKYAIKSGTVQYKTQVMGMEAIQTMMFDDYGAKEKTVVEMEMLGIKSQTTTITKDGFTYSYDTEKKTGTKTVEVTQSSNIDFENLTEEIKKDMKLEKIGEENFLGKSCDKYSIDYEKLKMKGTYLVWKGVPLKTNIDMSSMKIALEAIKFTEDPSFSASEFEVPADIKFQ